MHFTPDCLSCAGLAFLFVHTCNQAESTAHLHLGLGSMSIRKAAASLQPDAHVDVPAEHSFLVVHCNMKSPATHSFVSVRVVSEEGVLHLTASVLWLRHHKSRPVR